MSLIIRHLEGTAKVFSKFSVNGCVNLSLKFESLCLLMQIPKWK